MLSSLVRTRRPALRALPTTLAGVALPALLALAGCGGDAQDLDEVQGNVNDVTTAPPGTAVPFEAFDDDVGARGASERRAVIRTREAYEGYFGHAPPTGVDFPRQWVIFYAAGTKPSGGYEATVI